MQLEFRWTLGQLRGSLEVLSGRKKVKVPHLSRERKTREGNWILIPHRVEFLCLLLLLFILLLIFTCQRLFVVVVVFCLSVRGVGGRGKFPLPPQRFKEDLNLKSDLSFNCKCS